MPRKKDYGPPTRFSDRLQQNQTTTEESEEVTFNVESTLSGDEELEEPPRTPSPTRVENSLEEPENFQDCPQSPTPTSTPSKASMSSSKEETLNIEELLTVINGLQQEMRALKAATSNETATTTAGTTSRSLRGTTPANSIHGNAFALTGYAVRREFRPYGDDEQATNNHFDRKARLYSDRVEPFDGNPETFEDWVVSMADKFRRDGPTYQCERDRMGVLMNHLSNVPKQLVNDRYRSADNPWKSAAEIIGTLQAHYLDDNVELKASNELNQMFYDVAGPTTIKEFITRVDTLANKAGYPPDKRKRLLKERIPSSLGPYLVALYKDDGVSYEAFQLAVVDAAENIKASYEERQSKRKAAGHTYKATRPEPLGGRKEAQDRDSGKIDSKVATDTRECYLCKKPGHIAKDCPSRKKIARMIGGQAISRMVQDVLADDEESHLTNETTSSDREESGKE